MEQLLVFVQFFRSLQDLIAKILQIDLQASQTFLYLDIDPVACMNLKLLTIL